MISQTFAAMNTAQVSIITIGDELLIGQVVDTNSAWMAQQLNKAGIRVARRVAVGDVWDEIWSALDEESRQTDIILLTGGLGPTSDDITKPLLCKYFNGNLIVDKNVLQHVTAIFEKILKRPMIERNAKQAEVPDCCKVIHNAKGTAPGMWFEKTDPTEKERKKIFISMPGVPFEMKAMMETTVIPALLAQFSFPHIAHRTLLTAGVGESFLAEKISDFENNLPKHIKLAYLPNFGMVRLRLSVSSFEKKEAEIELEMLFTALQKLVKEYLVTNRDEPLQKVVARLLTENKRTISTAESCTGGYIAHLLTEAAGASEYFEGAVVCYSYQAKENLLGVNKKLLESNGAVSEEVVKQMLAGAISAIKTDYAIAVSGIMGPGGGTLEKPVGNVWIAVGDKDKTVAQQFNFRFDRERNMQLTAVNALNMVRKFILENEQLVISY